MTPKIMLVDDHGTMRMGIKSLIESRTDMEVVGQAENGQVAVELATELNPDVIIMDISMPCMNGIEATRLIKSQNPNITVIALSARKESSFIADMIDAGASRYVCKDRLFEELLEAIKEAVI